MQTENWKIRAAVLCLCVGLASACPGKIIYVDANTPGAGDGTSWENAYSYLRRALLFAAAGDEIRVAQGIYTAGGTSAKFELKNGVAVIGGYAGYGEPSPDTQDPEAYETILSGDLSGNDSDTNDLRELAGDPNRTENSREVVYAENLDANTILDGLTICGGVGTGYGSGMTILNSSLAISNCTFTRNSGYAVYIGEESNPTFTGCVFVENACSTSYGSFGGAMQIGHYCAPILVNCAFERNYRCGIRNYGNPELTNCTFTANDDFGVFNDGLYSDDIALTNCVFTGNLGHSIYNYECSPTIRDCTFAGNSGSSGAAIYNGAGAPMIINCTFKANRANYGGAIQNSSVAPVLINCAFIGNSAGYSGGAIQNEGSETSLLNCTFTGNSAYLGGAICSEWDTNVEIVNCILWGNSGQYGPQIAVAEPYYSPSGPLNIVIDHSNIQGGLTAIHVPSAYMRFGSLIDWGYGNIDCDPLFTEPDGADRVFGTEDDNVRLLPGSACIDAGDNSAVPSSISLDLDGDARIAGVAVDMGAYEGPDQALILSTRSLPVPEGSTAEFTVALAMDPNGPVYVNVVVRSGDADITVVSQALLEFDSSNYRLPQTVVLAAEEDPDRFTGTALICITASGLGTAGVAACEEENEPYPDTLLVDARAQGASDGSNWENAFTDLRAAISAASAIPQIKQIWVAQGTYRPAPPSGDRGLSFQLVNGLAIMGGYAGLKDRGRPGIDEPGSDARDTKLYETILSGDLNGDDLYVADPCDLMTEPTRSENSYHVVTAIDCNGTAVIDGVTITAGNANGSESSTQRGGGIYGGRPTVSNCIIAGNSATNYAGGISSSYSYADYYVNSGIVKDSVISGNAAASVGGVAFSRIANCIIKDNCAVITGSGAAAIGTATDCTFENNSTVGSGGVISAWNDSPVFIRCSFIGNSAAFSGGVLHVDGCGTCSDSYPDFQQCRFIGNSAGEYGGAAYSTSNSSVTFTDCLLVENSAGLAGGAIYDVSYLGGTMINCTVSGNIARYSGAGLCVSVGEYWYEDAFTLANSIFWDNCTGPDANQCGECDQICIGGSYHGGTFPCWCRTSGGTGDYEDKGTSEDPFSVVGFDMDFCCVQGLSGFFGGDGNIGEDPRFVGAEYGDFQLSDDSPCIDAGDNSAVVSAIGLDIDGNPRFLDDPNTPDTGYGLAPIVDMGAYESSRRDFLVGAYALAVPEGATAMLTVTMAFEPSSPVEVAVLAESADPDITIQSGYLLHFDPKNYSEPQTVVLAAAEDEDYLDGRAVVRISGPGLVTAVVTANEADNDPAPEVLYVDAAAPKGAANGASWADAFPTLQEALELAAVRAQVRQIRVAAGLYSPWQPNSYRRATFDLVPGVAVYGGFSSGGDVWENRDPNAHPTILSGDLNGDDGPEFANSNDNCYHVVTAINADANTVLDGFLVTGGNANGHRRREQTTGAGIYNCNAEIANCSISGNLAYDYGAGMYSSHGLTTNCRFTENIARQGGGMYLRSPDYEDLTATIVACTFADNRVEGSSYAGAGLYNDSYSKANLIDCTFTENQAQGYGGGLFNNDRTELNLTNCKFNSNLAAGQYASGGGLYNGYDSECTLSSCTFTGNQAAQGGAIANSTCILNLTDCTFNENSAIAGPGGAILGNPASLKACTFIANSATTQGGAIYYGADSITDCIFIGNTAETGGALLTYVSDGGAKFTNCLFSANSATSRGGAIYAYNSPDYLYLFNCTLSANTAAAQGGAVYEGYSPSSLTVYNSVIWGNLAPEGPQFNNTNSSSLIVSYSDVEGGWPGAGNTQSDPLFVRASNDGGDGWGVGDNDDLGDLRLRPGSPCIDAGNNTTLPQETDRRLTILDGDCNDAAVIDMGAYEFDFTAFGDIAEDCDVDANDFALLAARWKDSPCNEANNFCDLADIDRQNGIDFRDMLILAQNWLTNTK